MRMDLRFLNRPIEDLWAHAYVMFVFQRPGITDEVFSDINDIMGGSLEDLICRGFWTGETGENLLLATQNTLMADKLLLRGLGTREEFSAELLYKEVHHTGVALDKMGIREFAVKLPCIECDENEYESYLETTAYGFTDIFYERHSDDSDFLLKIFFSIDSGFLPEIGGLVRRLKEKLAAGPHISVISDMQIAKDYEEAQKKGEI